MVSVTKIKVGRFGGLTPVGNGLFGPVLITYPVPQLHTVLSVLNRNVWGYCRRTISLTNSHRSYLPATGVRTHRIVAQLLALLQTGLCWLHNDVVVR